MIGSSNRSTVSNSGPHSKLITTSALDVNSNEATPLENLGESKLNSTQMIGCVTNQDQLWICFNEKSICMVN